MSTNGTCKVLKSKTWHTFENFPATLVVIPDYLDQNETIDYEAEARVIFKWLESVFCTAMLMKLRDILVQVLGPSKVR